MLYIIIFINKKVKINKIVLDKKVFIAIEVVLQFGNILDSFYNIYVSKPIVAFALLFATI